MNLMSAAEGSGRVAAGDWDCRPGVDSTIAGPPKRKVSVKNAEMLAKFSQDGASAPALEPVKRPSKKWAPTGAPAAAPTAALPTAPKASPRAADAQSGGKEEVVGAQGGLKANRFLQGGADTPSSAEKADFGVQPARKKGTSNAGLLAKFEGGGGGGGDGPKTSPQDEAPKRGSNAALLAKFQGGSGGVDEKASPREAPPKRSSGAALVAKFEARLLAPAPQFQPQQHCHGLHHMVCSRAGRRRSRERAAGDAEAALVGSGVQREPNSQSVPALPAH